MREFFLRTLNLSITASWVFLGILFLKLLLRKAPRKIHLLLWLILGLRLLFPFSIESAWSLIPSPETVPMDIEMDTSPAIDSGIVLLDDSINPILSGTNQPGPGDSVNPYQIRISILANLQLLAFLGFLLHAAYSSIRLSKKLSTAVLYKDNIYQSEFAPVPFVFGLFRPRIFLPYHMSEKTMAYVIAHEQSHIRHKDHWWKALAYLLRSLYCFNPLLWLAYWLFARDLELACDERVIRELQPEQRADYSSALLLLSLPKGFSAAFPLAFSELSVKERVRSILLYKKPGMRTALSAAALCVLAALCFLTDPPRKETAVSDPFPGSYRVDDILYAAPMYSFIYTPDTAPGYLFSEDRSLYTANDVLDMTEGAVWVPQPGTFEETELTIENFDRYFQPKGPYSGWADESRDPKEIRKSILKAWSFHVKESDIFYYLLLDASGEIYLTYGYSSPEAPHIRWLFLLEASDLFICNAISEGMNAYFEPDFYPEGTKLDTAHLSGGEMLGSGKLILKLDLDVDELVVEEHYYEKTSDDSTFIHKNLFRLSPLEESGTKTSEKCFELEVSCKNPGRDEFAVYYIRSGSGRYIFKIRFIEEVGNSLAVTSKDDRYYLRIAKEGVTEIRILSPFSGGGCQNADKSPFRLGEEVYLEPLDGLTDLRGISIIALDREGKILYSLSIPRNADKSTINAIASEGWLLAPEAAWEAAQGAKSAFLEKDETLHMGLNARIIDIDSEAYILYVEDMDQDASVFGNRCALYAGRAMAAQSLLYVDYKSGALWDIAFSDFQVGDTVVITLTDSEKTRAFNASAAAEQIQLGTQRY